MALIGHMNYFTVNECGLYKYQDSKNYGCDLRETFDLIQAWAAGRAMIETLPWDPRVSRTGAPKCYLHDIHTDSASGDILLVLWKSDTDSTGALFGAQESGTVGQTPIIKYTDSVRGRRVIWGRPCYYWIVPELETIISIKFDHSLCDSHMMQDWIVACITQKVTHPNRVRETTEAGHIRLSFTSGKGGEPHRCRFGFDVALKTVSTSDSELSELAANVTHIIRRETITLNSQKDERAAWVKLFDSVPYLSPRPKSNRRQIEVRAEAKPTATEIRRIIETFAKQDRKRSEWDNLGFGKDSGGVVWVDRFRIKNTLEIDHDIQKGAISAKQLHARLKAERDLYLQPLRQTGRRTSAARR